MPLEPGDAITLTVGDAYYWPDHSNFSGVVPAGTSIYVQVDSANAETNYGAVLESHEIAGGPYNNIMGPVYPVTGVGRESVRVPPAITDGRLSVSSYRLPARP